MGLVDKSEHFILGKDDEGYALCDGYELKSIDNRDSCKLYIALEMPNNPLLAEVVGMAIFQCLKENFLANRDKDPYLRFEEALKKVNALVREKEKEKDFKFMANLNVALGVIARDNLYLSQAGDAEVYLIRGKFVSVISEGLAEEDNGDDLFINIASGTLEDHDVVLFSSTKLLRYLNEIDLSKIFSHYDLSEGIQELKNLLKTELNSKISIIAVDLKEAEVFSEEIPKVPTEHISKIKILELFKSFLAATSDYMTKKIFPYLKVSYIMDFLSLVKRKRNASLFLSIFLVVLLGIGVYNMRVESNENKLLKEYEANLFNVRENIDLSKTKANYDKEKAGELLDNAKNAALQVFKSGYLKKEASELLQQIQIQYDALDNIRRVGKNERRIRSDFSDKRSNVSALGILPYKDRLIVYEYNALYEVLLDKVIDPLTIDKDEYVTDGAYFEDQQAIIFLTKSGKLIEYKDGLFNFMDTDDVAWHTGVDLSAYSDKVYILDPQNNQIWKYKRKRDRYSAPDKYITDGDLTGGLSLAVDGSIYVLKSNGIIDKFYVGKYRKISILNKPIDAIKKPVSIYTEKEMDQVYVLDGYNSRVLMFYKLPNSDNLNYNMQIVFTDMDEELRDLYIDKRAQRLYVLSGTKLYEVEL